MHRLLFLWFFFRSYFERALSCLPSSDWGKGRFSLYALHRLGMHRSVMLAEWKPNKITILIDRWLGAWSQRALLAKVIAFIACDAQSESRVWMRLFIDSKPSDVLIIELIYSLSVYAPAEAYNTLGKLSRPHNELSLALSLRLSDNQLTDQSVALFDLCWNASKTDFQKNASVLLLRSNIESDSIKKLHWLNECFYSYGLSCVTLIDDQAKLSVTNIQNGHRHEMVDLESGEQPLISIIMTCYNAQRWIAHAIESILAQTYSNWELLVIDDFSQDNTCNIVEDYSKQYSRVKLFRSNQNSGTYLAKLSVFQFAKGEFVTCHDSDDWSHPEKLFKQVQPMLKNRSIMATTSQWVRLHDDGYFYARAVYPLIRLNPSSLMFRRIEVYESMGLWNPVRTGADSEFIARIQLYFGMSSVKMMKLPLSVGAHHSGSLMNAEGTGYNERGVSLERLEYWEGWRRLHIDKNRP